MVNETENCMKNRFSGYLYCKHKKAKESEGYLQGHSQGRSLFEAKVSCVETDPSFWH